MRAFPRCDPNSKVPLPLTTIFTSQHRDLPFSLRERDKNTKDKAFYSLLVQTKTFKKEKKQTPWIRSEPTTSQSYEKSIRQKREENSRDCDGLGVLDHCTTTALFLFCFVEEAPSKKVVYKCLVFGKRVLVFWWRRWNFVEGSEVVWGCFWMLVDVVVGLGWTTIYQAMTVRAGGPWYRYGWEADYVDELCDVIELPDAVEETDEIGVLDWGVGRSHASMIFAHFSNPRRIDCPLYLPSSYMTKHPIPYIALSTSLLTAYQSALLSANSYTSSARKIPWYLSLSAIMVANSLHRAILVVAAAEVEKMEVDVVVALPPPQSTR